MAKGVRSLHVVAIILFVRILSVFLVQTWYVPDEYWQSLEVAHKQAFGYGALTWEWKRGIRSYLYPSIIAAFYSLLQLTGLDYPDVVVYLPRILQALLSTVGDYHFYKWTGERKWSLFLVLTSWFWFYTSSRTLIQTVETALVSVALSKFPFKSDPLSYYQKESSGWLCLACMMIFLRPTSAPVWLVMAAYHLFTTNQKLRRLLLVFYLPIGLTCGGTFIALDSYFHGSLLFTPYEFFKVNVLYDISSFYGKHPWYWYFSHGLPAVIGTHLVPALYAMYLTVRRPKENKTEALILVAILVHLAVYSFIPHKEFRFLLPLLPMFLYLAQSAIVPWSRKAKKWQLYAVAGAILACNVAPSLYFGMQHQAGSLKVMPLLRNAITDNRTSVLFMMPCHSTPLYSHLHLNVTTRYLRCDPPNRGETYESEAFFNNPQRWWRAEYASRQTPTFVVLFDVLRGRVEQLLSGYRKMYEIPHTQFPEGEVGANVLLYKKIEAGRAQDAA